jgi:hypothetical protein
MRVLISIALLQFFLFNVSAQNNYVQFTGDVDTRVADIAHSALFTDTKLIAYSVEQTNGNKDIGLVAVDFSNVLQM